MRILILVNSHLPAIGGRELVVHNLALENLRQGHDVRVAGMGGLWGDRHVRFPYPVTRFPHFGRFPIASRLAMTLAHVLTHRYDIVHCHATYPSGYAALKVKPFIGAPVVITPHGEDINIVEEIGFGQRLDPVQRPLIEWTVREADATTAISQTVHASLLDAGAPESRIHDIANGVDMRRFSRPRIAGLAERYGFPAGTPVVVSIGNYHPVKGHEVLVEAAAMAHQRGKPFGVIIVGRTQEAFCRDVAAKDCAPFVKFAGVLPVPDWREGTADPLAELLTSADFYVSSSVGEGAEGLSLSLLEGMAAGLCPVVSNISGNRDMVKDGANGRVVPPRDPSALAEAIMGLMHAPDELRRLSAAARETAGHFGWDAVARQYLDLYADLIKRSRH